MGLSEFFQAHKKVALAFSGGVDSAYLLYAAIQSGADIRAYYVKSAFQPQFELEDAKRMARELRADLQIIEVDVLCNTTITENPLDRCYHCKKSIFSTIAQQAVMDGYHILLDGTNASDDVDDRPGMKALQELSVLSPLRECGLTKIDIRRLSKDAGLFTWNKPAYACLATRIPTGERITLKKLARIEWAEDYLFSLGFTDFRVRCVGDTAKIQVTSSQYDMLMANRRYIVEKLKNQFASVVLDMEARDE
ncbi:MAG TPA: ATP-dependent sacrificial sulfur transferase LarE [Bacillota bacterium]|nr:ATP-dependent sacrificial sulfur transferase LarE [Bacillota bacterium]